MNEDELVRQISEARDLPELEEVRVRLMGRKGVVTEQLKTLGRPVICTEWMRRPVSRFETHLGSDCARRAPPANR